MLTIGEGQIQNRTPEGQSVILKQSFLDFAFISISIAFI